MQLTFCLPLIHMRYENTLGDYMNIAPAFPRMGEVLLWMDAVMMTSANQCGKKY